MKQSVSAYRKSYRFVYVASHSGNREIWYGVAGYYQTYVVEENVIFRRIFCGRIMTRKPSIKLVIP